MKFWINEKDKSTNIIVISKEVFYLYNPNERTLREFRDDLILGKIPAKLSGIAFARIRKIDFEEGKDSFEIHYDQKDKRKINLPNSIIKAEIQEALETDGAPYLDRKITEKGFFERSYGYWSAILAVGFITFVSCMMAVEMDKGFEFTSGGLANVPIAIAAYMGTIGSLFLGISLIALILLRLFFVLKTKKTFDRFIYIKGR